MSTQRGILRSPMSLVIVTAALVVVADRGQAGGPAGQSAPPTPAGWTQWGGPNRDFVSDSKGLADGWPADGPKRIWSRGMGEGHSAISADGARLYTLYRPLVAGSHADEEVIAALDAATGATVWEYRFESPMAGAQFGPYIGPHSTPLVTADRVYAAGSRKHLFALDKETGKVLWSHHLIREYGAPEGDRGYAASPLLHKDLVIVSVGGIGQALAAFNARTGALVWKAGNIQQSPSSPILIDVDGQPQVVYFGGDAVAGLDPGTGRTRWTYPHRTSASLNISTPVWSAAENLLFVSSAYGHGGRVLELRQSGGRTTVTERWFSNRIRVHFSNIVRVGSLLVGSTGDFGPVFLSGIDVQSGAIAWQDRTFARAQVLSADGKLLVLDEDGTLGLATVSPAGLRVLAKAKVLENIAWTPPTLVGTRLYVRDRRTIAAYDLAR